MNVVPPEHNHVREAIVHAVHGMHAVAFVSCEIEEQLGPRVYAIYLAVAGGDVNGLSVPEPVGQVRAEHLVHKRPAPDELAHSYFLPGWDFPSKR